MVGALAIVGQVLDDGEARTAVGAVRERVAVAAVGRLEQLAAAVVAGGDVGRDELVGEGSAALSRMENSAEPSAAAGSSSRAAMKARGGVSRGKAARNAATRPVSPSTWISTPAEVLRAQPLTPQRSARL